MPVGLKFFQHKVSEFGFLPGFRFKGESFPAQPLQLASITEQAKQVLC
jgi:hypothetical protein